MLEKILLNIGLTDKESKLYLASLALGPSVITEIAKKAGINRVTAYDIMERLIYKGFINYYHEQNSKYFSPTDPEIIVFETERKTTELKKALPDLQRIYAKNPHPHVQYFEGLEGIKKLYADTLTSKTDIINYSNSKEIRIHWPEYDEEYVAERIKKKIFLKGIAPYDDYGRKVQSDDKASYREFRLVPGDQFTFTNEINIYDDKVAISSFTNELIGMIIQSQAIADTQRDIFKMAWEYAGR